MPTPSDIQSGVLLRVINSHSIGAPVGSLATVQTVEQSLAGDWLCTITWHEVEALERRAILRSYLWAVDLSCFEIVHDVQRAVAKQVTKAEARRQAKLAQIKLPFTDEGTRYEAGS